MADKEQPLIPPFYPPLNTPDPTGQGVVSVFGAGVPVTNLENVNKDGTGTQPVPTPVAPFNNSFTLTPPTSNGIITGSLPTEPGFPADTPVSDLPNQSDTPQSADNTAVIPVPPPILPTPPVPNSDTTGAADPTVAPVPNSTAQTDAGAVQQLTDTNINPNITQSDIATLQNAIVSGAVNAQEQTTRPFNYNVVTSIPDLADINITNKTTRLSDPNSTSYFAVLPSVTTYEVSAAIQYRNAFKGGTPLNDLIQFYRGVEEKFFTGAPGGGFSVDSIWYWVRKHMQIPEITDFASLGASAASRYTSTSIQSQPSVKSAVSKYKTNLNSFFTCVSDSIGLLANSKYHQLDSTQPIFDVAQQFYGVPIPFSANMENKIGPTARNLIYNLSKHNTAIYRRNLMGVAYYNPTYQENLKISSRVAHGQNLVNDIAFFVDFAKKVSVGARTAALGGIISAYGGKLLQFVNFISNIGNKCAMNLRDIYAPINGYDRDFTVTPGSTDINAGNLNVDAIQKQIDTVNTAALQDANIANQLYKSTNELYSLNSALALQGGSVASTALARSGFSGVIPTLPAGVTPTAPTINSGDTNNVGSPSQHTVSIYGSVYTDFTTYLDTKPTERPADATAYWLQKYNLTQDQLDSISNTYANPANTGSLFNLYGIKFTAAGNNSPLTLANTTQGAYVGSLVPGFDIGVPSNGSYNYPPRSIIYVTDSQGNPIGNNNGYFRVADTGQSALIKGQSSAGAVDFYSGNDPTLTNYFKSLNSSGTILNFQPVNVTGQSAQNLANIQNGTATAVAPTVSQTTATAQASQSFTPTASNLQPIGQGITNPVASLNPPAPTGGTAQGAALVAAGLAGSLQPITPITPTPIASSAKPYSNRQLVKPVAFRIRVEDINGRPNFIDVDYLLKKIVKSNYDLNKAMINLVANSSISKLRLTSGTPGQSLNAFILTLQAAGKLLPNINNSNFLASNFTGIINSLGGGSIANNKLAAVALQQLQQVASQNALTTSTLTSGLGSLVSIAASRLPINILGAANGATGIYNSAVSNLGLGGLSTGSLLNAVNPLNDIDINISGIIPSVNLGSLGDIAKLAGSIASTGDRLSISSLNTIQDIAKQINQIICDFQLPTFAWPLINEIMLLYKTKFNIKDLPSKLWRSIKKFFTDLVDKFNPEKLIKALIKQIEMEIQAYWAKIWNEILTCNAVNQQKKNGKPIKGVPQLFK